MGRIGQKKTGGRAKGVKNKDRLPCEEKARELGVDPFTILLWFASANWKALGYDSGSEIKYTQSGQPFEVDKITCDQRLKAAADAAQYLYPKRKSIETNITATEGAGFKIVIEDYANKKAKEDDKL